MASLASGGTGVSTSGAGGAKRRGALAADRATATAASADRSKSSGRPVKRTALEQEPLLMHLRGLLEAIQSLFAQLPHLLEIVVLSEQREPRRLRYQSRREELEALLDLLEEVAPSAPTTVQKELLRVSKQVRLALPALLHFAQELEAGQQEAIAQLGETAVGLVAWAWQRRAILGKQPEHLLEGLNPAWRATAECLMRLWNGAVRASSVVENWHSVLRPHLAVHRTLSAGLLALLAVWHNHRVAPRGEHKDLSPLQRSGMTEASTEWLVALGYPSVPLASRLASLKCEDKLAA